MRKQSILLALSLGLFGLQLGCGTATSGGGAIENQIFTGTSKIDISATSLAGGSPDFSWVATSRRHVVAAVFSEHISVSKNKIQNPTKAIWIWHSGLTTGREGNVQYANGVANVDTKAAPTALASGTYYWAVWAFDDRGIPAVSSAEQTLTIP